MKKRVGFICILLLFILTACNQSLTVSDLQVVEKGSSDKETWIIAFDPNNQTEKQAFKILIQEEMVWNLIEVEKRYFAGYSPTSDTSWKLERIESIEDEKTLK